MEKKTTQRIVGILVIIALVIILMPLLLDKNEAATQVSSTKAPPFPDQQNQASATNVASDQKDNASYIDIPPDVADKINKAANGTSEPSTVPAVEQQPDQVAQGSQPSGAATPVTAENAATSPTNDTVANPAQPTPQKDSAAAPSGDATKIEGQAPAAQDATPQSKKPGEQALAAPTDKPVAPETNQFSTIASTAKPVVEKIIKAVDAKTDDDASSQAKSLKVKHHVRTASAVKSHDLSKLKKKAWAVQLGSFKNKDNARRLADRLRAAGFNAFTHEVKSAKHGPQTRVYIGPEYREASAIKLSSKIEQQMKMHGFIVSFKPLEL